MRSYRLQLVGFVLPLVNGDVQAAEDVVQETLLRGWQHARELIPYGSCLVKRSGRICWDVLPAGVGHAGWPFGGCQRAGDIGVGQVVGLTALAGGRDDRGRGRSPRLSGLVEAG